MQSAHPSNILGTPGSWEDIPRGASWRAALEQQLQPWWPKMYGYHLLKIGNLSAEINSEKCPISHQVNVGPHGGNLQVIADPYLLPFAEKSVDACLVAHTLAYAADPHRILREVDRVLIDDGWLVMTHFNLLSLLGIGKLVPVVRHRQPFRAQMFTQMRLLDWLGLLNYEVMYQSRVQVLPWCRQGGKMLSTHLPALGCLGVMVARKRTLPLTPTAKKIGLRKPSLSRAVGATKSYRDIP